MTAKIVAVFILSMLTLPFTGLAMAQESGILKKQSPHSVVETVSRLEAAIKAKGMKVFPRFDHSAAAQEFGQTMRPAIVVSFGNPRYGTKFMVANPVASIDFPPKATVYEDETGKIWLAYNSAEYLYNTIFRRHGLTFPDADVDFYRKVLEEVMSAAVKQ
jgi:uncharacterized protein (DUF302 family)